MKDINPANMIAQIEAVNPVHSPTFPVAYLVTELQHFGSLMQEDIELFLARKVSQDFIDVAPLLAAEINKRESIWITSRFDTPQAQAEWKLLVDQAYDMDSRLSAELKVVLYNHPEELRYLNANQGSHTVEKLLSHLSRLIELVNKNTDLCAEVGLDESMVAEAQRIHAALAVSLANKREHSSQYASLKQKRDQACTIGQNYLSMVRVYADAIYHDDPAKRAEYNRKKIRPKAISQTGAANPKVST